MSGDRPDNWFYWICSQSYMPDKKEYLPNDLCSDGQWQKVVDHDKWNVYGFDIDHCLSERVDSQCTLNVAVDLLFVVIACNLIILVAVTVMLVKIKETPLITIGDAVSSFIINTDKSTMVRGLFEVVAIFALFGYAVWGLQKRFGFGDIKSLWNLGFGAIEPHNVITGWAAFTQRSPGALSLMVLIANFPQAYLSKFYLLFNGLITSMTLADEWNRHAYKRRALRVSEPRGEQRSTYFLQVPYQIGVPLMVSSTLLHWIICQSVFLANIDKRSGDNRNPLENLTTESVLMSCGYSPSGMILTILIPVGLLTAAALLGTRKLPPGIPLAGSCSVAISAACHAPEDTSDELPLIWGAIPDESDDGVGHCSFSSGPVDKPVEGRMYA
ncbi:hypothetical protein GTA08_BOTSDO06373 [Neofusicoccum parvum]|uniref:Uncharacterized protein n=1 Tax=Neofusicoccum parvum TaxID=310453 RepID=A0ACB5SJC6_9PEZI|nr:hypothetical protein GTA08_BOTSDO06373 [Neofusicoccum parvum]